MEYIVYCSAERLVTLLKTHIYCIVTPTDERQCVVITHSDPDSLAFTELLRRNGIEYKPT